MDNKTGIVLFLIFLAVIGISFDAQWFYLSMLGLLAVFVIFYLMESKPEQTAEKPPAPQQQQPQQVIVVHHGGSSAAKAAVANIITDNVARAVGEQDHAARHAESREHAEKAHKALKKELDEQTKEIKDAFEGKKSAKKKDDD